MADEERDEFRESLEQYIGKSLVKGGPAVAPDPVNQAMIHNWIDAFEDFNPVYEHEDIAAQTRFGGKVAPQAMLQTWTMPRPIIKGIGDRGGSPTEIDPDSPIELMANAGYVGTLATNSELNFKRALREGDHLTSDVVLSSISPRKKTGLGLGYFVEWITTYTDQHGEEVGSQIFRILKFNPHTIGQ